MVTPGLRAPFPWFGGKSRAAHLVWQALGDPSNYVEPFAGSLAVLLGRPHKPRVETVNDRDAYLANFWRAVQAEPEEVARHADWPVSEVDLTARHHWLIDQTEFRDRMLADPDFHDAKIAGWWVWGLSQWIGTGWCERKVARLPHISDGGMGVHKGSLPHLGNPGMGVHRSKLPNLDGHGGKGTASISISAPSLASWMAALSDRLRRVRVACGDWERVLTPSVLRVSGGACGVFLDPPYADTSGKIYTHDEQGISARVREWAIEHGTDPSLRIVLAGYDSEHAMPPSWRCVEWKAVGGYGNLSKGANQNCTRERLWLSPACLRMGEQQSLFDRMEATCSG